MSRRVCSKGYARQRIIAVVAIGLVLGGVSGVLVSDIEGNPILSSGASGSLEDYTFASDTLGIASIFLYGFQTGTVELPPNVSLRTLRRPVYVPDVLVSKQAAFGFVLLPYLPTVLEKNEDARILPYQIRWPPDGVGVYATRDANITGPEDLTGRRLGIPGGVPTNGEVFSMMEQEYGITITDVELVQRRAIQLRNVSSWDEFDAALVYGSPPAGVAPVFYPLKRMEARFGDVGFGAVFVVSDPQYMETAEAVMTSINRSILVAAERPDAVTSYLSATRGPPPENFASLKYALAYRDGYILGPMTEGHIASLQYRLGLYMENPPNISSRIVRKPE